ncbi:uncharacterized protein LOC119730883 [Patiria miniata]|uniref:PiggyBac transposable element-derived protein domain-containing protein n=1 Tax=Patiria miniata TaxID=46514 RepID=A0A914A7W6_PATMI|nr:uncharacterized protein LOC119730883 [Patiria miniata]
MTDITTKVLRHHRHRHHHVFTDRLYTSIPQARALLARQVYLSGVIKSNSRGLPKDLTGKLAQMRRIKRGTFHARQNSQLVATAWKDSKAMLVLSSAHQGWRDPDTHNVQRKVPDDSGRRKSKVIPAPPQVIDYINNMGGVDRGDQLRANYTCSRKAQYWWKKILYFLIDISRVNANICYAKHRHQAQDLPSSSTDEDAGHTTTKLLSHANFILELDTELVNGYAGGSTNPQ